MYEHIHVHVYMHIKDVSHKFLNVQCTLFNATVHTMHVSIS